MSDEKLFRVLRAFSAEPDNLALGAKFASMYMRMYGDEKKGKFDDFGVARYDGVDLSYSSWEWLINNAEYLYKDFPRDTFTGELTCYVGEGPHGQDEHQSLIQFVGWLDDAKDGWLHDGEGVETYDVEELMTTYDSNPPAELLKIMIEAANKGYDYIEFYNDIS